MKKSTIVIAAGGTAGHVFPAAAVAKILSNNNEVICISDRRGVDFWKSQLDNNEQLKILPVTNIKKGIGIISSIYNIFISAVKSIFLVRKADVVIGFGGFASFPALAAALLCRIPIVLHEQNAAVGLVNRIFTKYAKILFISFNIDNKTENTILVGNPIRRAILETKRRRTKITKEIQLFITGGSQGAKFFDLEVAKAIVLLPKNIKENLKIIQQVRKENIDFVKNIYDSDTMVPDPIIEPFFGDAPQIIADSDLVISRAGATAISELRCLNIPAILIPIPNSSDNHQYLNAKILSKDGESILLEEREIDELPKILTDLLSDNRKLNDMRNVLKNITPANAAQKIAIKINQLFMKI